MQIYIKGRSFRVTPSLRAYVEDKIGHLTHYLDQILDAHVTMRMERSVQIVDVILNLKHHVIKAEERSPDMYASIDLVRDRLEQQIRKFKTKHWAHHVKANGKLQAVTQRATGIRATTRRTRTVQSQTDDEADGADKEPKIVREKRMILKKMRPSEAAHEMALLGHDFFLFVNDQTGSLNVLYKRRGGQLGLIETTS